MINALKKAVLRTQAKLLETVTKINKLERRVKKLENDKHKPSTA